MKTAYYNLFTFLFHLLKTQQDTSVFVNKTTFHISSEIFRIQCLKYHNTRLYFSVTLNYHLCVHMH